MRGHYFGGADTLIGLSLGVTLTAVIILSVVALYWFLWPSLTGRDE